MAIVKYWEDSEVYLEPIEHVYIHKQTNERYTSVTRILSALEPEFDTEGVSLRISEQSDTNPRKNKNYIGMTQQEIKDEWKRVNDEANEYGTYIHETIERYLLAQKWYVPKNDLEKEIIYAYDEVGVNEGRTVYPERIMFSNKYKIAGTSDLIIEHDDVYFSIGDMKGLALDTPILTSNGWKTMGTLNYNDMVYDKNGELTKIKAISDIKNKKCYKIKFDNNSEVVSDFEHRWFITFTNGSYKGKLYNKEIVMTTEELYKHLNNPIIKDKNGINIHSKIPKIFVNDGLKNEPKYLPIDPYVLGVWLSDGHSSDTKVTQMNEKVWSEIKNRGYDIGEDVSQGGSGKATTRTIFNLRRIFNENNLLKNKHIPNIYFNSSYEQRLDLLRGFMDADGTYHKKRKRYVMSTTKEWQRDEIVKLLGTLGVKTTVIPSKRTSKKGGNEIKCYDICFTTRKFNPFLCRNEDIVVNSKGNYSERYTIKEIYEVESVPTICIEVESETHTFLFGYDMIVTHNTNKSFDFYSEFGTYMHEPLEHLPACQFVTYSLQLSIYALMYLNEFPNKKWRESYLLYYDRDTKKFTKINTMFMRAEAEKILENHLKSLS